MRVTALLSGLLLLTGAVGWGQSPCPQASVLQKNTRTNIFTEQQEVELGEVAAQSMAQSIRVIEEEALVAPLRRIGERLAAQMPASKLRFRVFLIDDPDANAFALPGGRIYVTRKLITSTRSEDELAGVVAHEMGHQLNHDSAIQFSKYFKEYLDIKSVGDREDIENKYHQLLDSYRKKDISVKADQDESQLNADEVSVFAMARAGYDPLSVVNFWDRFTERKGRKGSWFSDMFGTGAPETKRLREFAKKASHVPAGCIEKIEISQAAYDQWKREVTRYNGFGKREAVPHLLSKQALDPPLHGEFKRVRFSPNGRYLLAQDDASIFVLQREPLQVLFRIDARDAYPAHFTPDSQHIVFHDELLRVSKWSVPEQERVSLQDVYIFRGCMQSLLSPDGSVLACFKADPDKFIPVGIRLIEVANGNVLYEKKDFIDASFNDGRAWAVYKYFILQHGSAFSMGFSPDGRYFLAGIALHTFGYDFKDQREIKLPGSLKTIMETSFTFLGPDTVVGVDGERGDHSKMVRVPLGQVLRSNLNIGPLAVEAATAGEYIIVRPLIDAPAGIMDLKENKIFLASKTEALDVYEGTWASERANGELALYRRPQTTPLAKLALPRGPLGSIRAAIFSPDLSLLAVSNDSRGKIWVMGSHGGANLGGFRGAWLDSNIALINFAPPNIFRKLRTRGVSEKDLRKEEGEKRGNTIARIDLVQHGMKEVAWFQKHFAVRQIGSTYAVLMPKDPVEHPGRDVTLEVHDMESGRLLWSRTFKRMPGLGWNPGEEKIVLIWDLTTKAAKEELKQDPEAVKLAENIKQPDESYFVAELEARTGNTIARFPIDTGKGSYHLKDVYPAGQYLLFMDTNHRVLVYNQKGERLARCFGGNPAVSMAAGLVAIEREPGRMALYQLPDMAEREEFTFEAPIEHAQFSADGRRLAVLTEDQQVYIIDAAAAGKPRLEQRAGGTKSVGK